MMTTSGVNTYNTTYGYITSSKIEKLDAGYTSNEADAFQRSLVAIARRVPTQDEHGLAGLLLAKITITKVKHPGELKDLITENDSSGTIAKKTAEYSQKVDYHFTQKGGEEGLKELISTSAPESVIQDLKDKTFGYAKTTAEEMLKYVKDGAETVDTLDVAELLEERDRRIDFDGEETLKVAFQRIDKNIKDLEKHGVQSSESEMIIRILLAIKEYDEFLDEDIIEWDTEVANNINHQTWTNFKDHFIEADRKRRLRNRISKKTAKQVGYESVNHAEEKAMISQYIDKCMECFAEDAGGMLNQLVDDKIAKHRDPPKEESEYAKKIKELEDTIANLKKQSGGGSGGNDGSNSWWKCPHCNRKHHPKFPKDKCYLHPKNKDKSPEDGGPPKDFVKGK